MAEALNQSLAAIEADDLREALTIPATEGPGASEQTDDTASPPLALEFDVTPASEEPPEDYLVIREAPAPASEPHEPGTVGEDSEQASTPERARRPQPVRVGRRPRQAKKREEHHAVSDPLERSADPRTADSTDAAPGGKRRRLFKKKEPDRGWSIVDEPSAFAISPAGNGSGSGPMVADVPSGSKALRCRSCGGLSQWGMCETCSEAFGELRQLIVSLGTD